MSIERWELLPSSQPDRYLLKIRGDKADVDMIVRTYSRVCQEPWEVKDAIYQWAIYVVGATLNERLAIQDYLREMSGGIAAPSTPPPSVDLSGVLSELTMVLEGLTGLTEEEQAHVAKKMQEIQQREADPPPMRQPFPPAADPRPAPAPRPAQPLPPPAPAAPLPIPRTDFPSPPPAAPPSSPTPPWTSASQQPVKEPPKPKEAPKKPDEDLISALESFGLPTSEPPKPPPPAEPPRPVPPAAPFPPMEPTPSPFSKGMDADDQIRSIEKDRLGRGAEPPLEIVRDVAPLPIRSKTPSPEKAPAPPFAPPPVEKTPPAFPSPIKPQEPPPAPPPAEKKSPLFQPLGFPPPLEKKPVPPPPPPAAPAAPGFGFSSPPPLSGIFGSQDKTPVSSVPLLDQVDQIPDDQLVRAVCFYAPGNESAKDKFLSQFIDVAQKKAKKPLYIRTLMARATPMESGQAKVWIDAAKSVSAEFVFLLLPQEVLNEDLEQAIVQMQQAGLHCYMISQTEVISRILYVDLIVELMLVKRRR